MIAKPNLPRKSRMIKEAAVWAFRTRDPFSWGNKKACCSDQINDIELGMTSKPLITQTDKMRTLT